MLDHQLATINPMEWLTIVSVLLIGALSVLGMVNDRYKDTLTQCVGLSIITGMSVIIVLQFFTIGQSSANAYGAMLFGVAIYGLGTMFKHMRFQRRARNQKRRLHDA